MKKFYVGLAATLVIALGFGAVSMASANEFTPGQGFKDAAARGGEKDGPLHDLFLENLAEALGISSDDLAARLEGGEKLPNIAAEYGYEGEALKELLTSVRDATIEDALATGLITEEQAERAREFGGRRGPGRRGKGRFGGGDGVLREYFENAMADALGMSVEELQAMKEDGTKLTDLGYTEDELKEIFEQAREAAIEQAMEDGVITEEDLENFQNHRQNRQEDGSSGPSFGPGFSNQSLDG